MRWKRLLWPTAFGALASVAGCGDDDTADGGTGNTGNTGNGGSTGTSVAGLVVDANRDGLANPEDPADVENSNLDWSAELGASFITNIDDDDMNGVRDADDDIVNGPEDEKDLARIMVTGWSDAPPDAVGTLYLDEPSIQNVRLFKKGADGVWTLVAGTFGACATSTDPGCTFGGFTVLLNDEVRAGVELGIEGRDFVRKGAETGLWQGTVQLTYQVTQPDGAVVAESAAKLKSAPWLLFGNLAPHDRVYTFGPIADFVAGIKPVVEGAGLEYFPHPTYPDRWTQDWFQTGWAAIPVQGEDGTARPHGMRYANARSHSQAANNANPYDFLRASYLGPDRGVFVTYEKYNQSSTFDSHGNHDLIPPHTAPDGTAYPMGRILIGRGNPGVLQATQDFYNAQKTQAPILTVFSDWLIVAHVDEVFSYVPAATERGWKLLVGNPTLARTMLQTEQTAGNGATTMHYGKMWGPSQPAEISIDEVLADPDLMSWAQESQSYIDDMYNDMLGATGLDPATEVLSIPYLFEELQGYKVAYQPGTANMLVFGDYAIPPDPFGPIIGGQDIFKKDLTDRLGTALNQLGREGQGMQVSFADDWTGYHINLGEVHCGTNAEGSAPFDANLWWEAGR
jgi:protein-arginine deiminase